MAALGNNSEKIITRAGQPAHKNESDMKSIIKQKHTIGRKLEWCIDYGVDGYGWQFCFRINKNTFDCQIMHLFLYMHWFKNK